MDGDTPFRTECCVPGSLIFCTLPAVGLHISSHLQRKCFNPLNLASWRLLLWKMPPSLFVLLTRVQTDWIFSLACDMPWGKRWCLTDFCLGSLCAHNCAPLASRPRLMSESQVPAISPCPVLGSQNAQTTTTGAASTPRVFFTPNLR